MKAKSDGGPLEIRPIGLVHCAGEEQAIEIFPDYAEALLRIDQAAELQVLYWMHRLSEAERGILSGHPRGDRSKPHRGVFALRSPMRPNPIGSTTVRLLRREGNTLLVSGLDAIDGSPVIDIKIVS